MLTLLKNVYKSPTIFRYSVLQNNLGRWRIENERKTNLKTDYANNDHCSCSYMKIEDDTNVEDHSMYLIEFVQDCPIKK